MTQIVQSTLLMSLGLGTMMTFASTHWLLAWMGIEINTLALIPLMVQNPHPRAVEAATKYFFAQTVASALLLFATFSNSYLTGTWNIPLMSHPTPMALCILALAMKVGLAPLHTWLPEVMQALDLRIALILSTWQKLAPLYLMYQIPLTNSNILLTLGLLSIIVGGLGGFNQVQLRKILAYSSIAHLGWMILILSISPPLTLLALYTYLLISTSLFLSLMLLRAKHISSLSTSWAKIPTLTAILPFILLSLGGLPPLTGFAPKWLITMELVKEGMTLMALIAILSSLLSLYFYLRLFYTTTLTTPPNNLPGTLPWRFHPQRNTLVPALTITATISLLPLTPTILAYLTW
uniref:NADH-ubiquinone oxidoreductase chain 2 n=1 Tax=Poeciliopsis monacha x P. lucida TaxID=197186 RepID=Q8M286_9TELE|nr:NADH dehydrogenase subunit 2 [Poeciliopsis monacha x P. lucida]UVN16249.1 NADH dehydrogenase subunit 2 [Poeciliopsis monacha x P. lucida]